MINTRPAASRIFHYSSAPNSLLVYSADRRAELFEFSSCNRNLFKTAPQNGNNCIRYSDIGGRVVTNSRNVVCFSGHVFYVFDMENAETIAEVDVGFRIMFIRCSTDAIALEVMDNNYEKRVLLYAWNGRRTAELIRVFNDVLTVQISQNGVLAITRKNGIELFNAHSRTALGRIQIEEGSLDVNHSLHLNVDGTMLAVQSGERLLFFDTKAKEPLSELALPLRTHIHLADDFRVFWQFTVAGVIILTTLDFGKERKISIAYMRQIPAPYYLCSVQFRRISGVQHVQFVTKENVLKLYRLDAIEKQWYPVE